MAFQAKLSSDTILKISNHDNSTHLSLHSDGEDQGSSVSSGEWKNSPTLFETSDGLVLKIEGDETYYTAIKDGSTHSLSSEPDLKDAKEITLEKISDEDVEAHHMKPMEPMKPMAPMKPMDS
ncbi:hypothetical protein IAD21_01537 [Abditibacteriota bacterium]|nr:hypothetical protein IAD21_01537 [Abditibacteriota bacterium]